jgi:putative drug exporter of the RND superfamily
LSGFNAIGRLTYRYRWLVVLLWGIVVLGSAFFAPNLSERLKGGGFEGADTESERVHDIMIEDFGASPARLLIVFEGDGSPPVRSEEFQQEQNASLEGVREIEETRFVTTYSDSQDERFISEDGDDSYAVVGFEVSENQTQELVDRVRQEVKKNAPEGLQTYVTGAPAVYLDIQNASSEDIRQAEAYVFPLALCILVVAFGSIVAAGLPVLVGGASVVTTLSALYFLSGAYDMSVFSLSIATMLGLGLGIDYALFAVSRFREELENYPVAEAVPRTMATAGRSIFFSGTAVLIGLSGLLFFPVHVHALDRGCGRGGGLRHGRGSTDASTGNPRYPGPPGERPHFSPPLLRLQAVLVLGTQRGAGDAPPSDRAPRRRRRSHRPAAPGAAHEGRYPRG